jgi:hypothetical protein
MGIGKIIIGLILVIVGLWAIIPTPREMCGSENCGFGGFGLYVQLWEVIKGVVPAFLVFIGAILVWIEWEELKIEKPTKKRR